MHPSQPREAFSLIELLVAVAIVGVVSALTLSAVQRVRDSSARTSCANNLRQIALAAHQYHDTTQVFPAGMRYQKGADPYLFMSWLTQLLPYIDQDSLWGATQDAYKQSPSPFPPDKPPHAGLATVVKTFACPADPRAGDVQVAQTLNLPVALTSYLGVEGENLSTHDGMLFVDSSVRLLDVKDGTSNTLLAGERPPSSDFVFGWWYAGAGQRLTGSADMVLGVEELNMQTRTTRACEPGVYRFAPGQFSNPCDALHFWSPHTGGANFAFADGSSHFLKYSAAPLMPALASRAGGEDVSSPD